MVVAIEELSHRHSFYSSNYLNCNLKMATATSQQQQPHLIILYGTEIGNGEDVTKRITWEAKRRRARVLATPLCSYDFDLLINPIDPNTVHLFILSTLGQGDVPPNAVPFWRKLMRKSLTPTTLEKLKCTAIGLGDSSYAKYNFVGKKLYKRLKQLGADLVLDLCLGDDQHDYGCYGAVDPFIVKLFDRISELNPLPPLAHSPDFIPPATFAFTQLTDETSASKNESNGSSHTGESKQQQASFDEPAQIEIISNERVTSSDHFQETRFIRFRRTDRLNYVPGDVLAVLPSNDPNEVTEFCQLLGLNPSSEFAISQKESNATSYSYRQLSSIGKVTIGQLVSNYLDLHAVPKRTFFELIWKFSPNEVEKEKLREFATTEGQEELYDYAFRPKRMIIEVLRDFTETSSKIPLEYLPDLIPVITRREFSIASSPKVELNEIDILMLVVEYKTRIKTPRTGLCSNYLAKKKAGEKITGWINPGTFVIPSNDIPVILVGPGTGVAPLRSIIQDRLGTSPTKNNTTSNSSTEAAAETVLFFGARNRKSDFYFESDWKRYQGLKLFTAFSRDQEKKVYVQHVMWQQRELIQSLMIDQNGVVLISGNTNQMPEDVRDMLVKIVAEKCNTSEAEAIVSGWEVNRRLQYETWE